MKELIPSKSVTRSGIGNFSSLKLTFINTTINTIQGEALYSHTEIEDENGRWNDNWYTTSEEYVIHEGSNHHVYIVQRA